MQRVQKRQRQSRIERSGIGKSGPILFVKRADQRRLLSQCQFASNIAVHMAVGKMVNDLPDSPASGPVRRIKLFFI